MADLDPPLRRGGLLLSGDCRGAVVSSGHGSLADCPGAGTAPRCPPEPGGRPRPRSEPMSCAPFETLSAYVDDALPELESASIGSHVQSCSACRSQLDELRWLKEAVRTSASSAEASEEVKAGLVAGAARRQHRQRRPGVGPIGA